MMMLILISKKLASVLALVALAGLLGWRTCARLMEDSAGVNRGRLFHDLARGTSARFVIRGATDLHLASYFVVTDNDSIPAQYTLQLAFFSADNKLRDQRIFHLSVDNSAEGPWLPDGTKLARPRLLRIVAPADSTVMQVVCTDGRVLLQAGWLTSRHPSREALLRRSGVPTSWFAEDELDEVRSQRFMRLSELGNIPLIALPLATEPVAAVESATATDLSVLRVGPQRAVVWNVVGPGTMSVALPRQGSFRIEYLGVGGSGRAPVVDGSAALNLPSGVSSVILRALAGSSGDVGVQTTKLRPLGGAPDTLLLPSERWSSAWHAEDAKPLHFPMYGLHATPLPVRITARTLDGRADKPLSWRFFDDNGHRLQDGVLTLDDGFDPFSAVERDGHAADIGMPSQLVLIPPKGTAILSICAERMIVEVDTFLEDGAEPTLLPPFDVPLRRGLHWVEAPSRGPRWLMLAPLATQAEQRVLRASLLSMPRLEPHSLAPEPGPWVSLTPRGTPRKGNIAEPAHELLPEENVLTMLSTGDEVAVDIVDKGRNGRRVMLTCDVAKELGGRIELFVDGKRKSSAPIVTSTVRLETPASAGMHRVRVQSARRGQCVIEAPAHDGQTLVRRRVYLLSERSRGALSVRVATHRHRIMRVHYAVYSEAPLLNKNTEFTVQVDRGLVQKRPALPAGAPEQSAQSAQSAHHGGKRMAQKPVVPVVEAPIQLLHEHRTLWRVAQSSVRLGKELSAGHHNVTLGTLAPGRYWARFWIHGTGHHSPAAESWITTEAQAHAEAGE